MINTHDDSQSRNGDKDAEFVQQIINRLDESVADIDDVSLQRLKKSREQVLQSPRFFSHKRIALSMVASFALLLLIPVMWNLNTPLAVDHDTEIVLQDVPLSVDEMDDLDMLMALEDTDA